MPNPVQQPTGLKLKPFNTGVLPYQLLLRFELPLLAGVSLRLTAGTSIILTRTRAFLNFPSGTCTFCTCQWHDQELESNMYRSQSEADLQRHFLDSLLMLANML